MASPVQGPGMPSLPDRAVAPLRGHFTAACAPRRRARCQTAADRRGAPRNAPNCPSRAHWCMPGRGVAARGSACDRPADPAQHGATPGARPWRRTTGQGALQGGRPRGASAHYAGWANGLSPGASAAKRARPWGGCDGDAAPRTRCGRWDCRWVLDDGVNGAPAGPQGARHGRPAARTVRRVRPSALRHGNSAGGGQGRRDFWSSERSLALNGYNGRVGSACVPTAKRLWSAPTGRHDGSEGALIGARPTQWHHLQ
jgi:hypothetical protein